MANIIFFGFLFPPFFLTNTAFAKERVKWSVYTSKVNKPIPRLVAAPVATLRTLPSKCVGKDCFDWTTPVDGKPVSLRGAGLFRFLRIEVYTAAFYSPWEAASTEDILGDVPKSLEFRYHHEIKGGDIRKIVDKNLRGNPNVDYKKIQRRLEKLDAYYHDVKPGDRYRVTYIPKQGTFFEFNGKQEIAVPGEDFAGAYFSVWISRYSINQKFRKTLLGLK